MNQRLMHYQGWIIAFSGTSINVILGAVYAWSVFGEEMVSQWKWTATDAVLPFAAGAIVFSVAALFAGRVQDLIGPRPVSLTGALLLGTGWVLCSLTRNPNYVFLAFSILCGAGTGLCFSVTLPTVLKWFTVGKRGLITGIVLSGMGLSAVFMSPLIKFLINHWGIQHAMQILGIGSCGIISFLSWLLRNPPAEYCANRITEDSAFESFTMSHHNKPAISINSSLQKEFEWWESIRTSQFYILWLIIVLSAAPGLMVFGNASLIVRVANVTFDPVLGPMILAALGTCGRLSCGFTYSKTGRLKVMVLFSLLLAVNMLAFPYYRTSLILFIGLALTGFFDGAFTCLSSAVTADIFGLKNMGVNYGMVNSGFGIAGFIGPLIGGRVYDWFGSFDRAFIAFASIMFVTTLLSFILLITSRSE